MKNRLNTDLECLLVAILMSMCVIAGIVCGENPENEKESELGKRDFSWELDTIEFDGSFQTMMLDIWGESSTNVYIVGHNDHNGKGTMFHYDGIEWKPVRLHVSEGGNVDGPISLATISGFGRNDIYAGGMKKFDLTVGGTGYTDSTLILHFDGVSWSEVNLPRKEGILDIDGTDGSNVWVVGRKGSIFHFDGLAWTGDALDSGVVPTSLSVLASGRVFVMCRRYDQMLPIDTAGFYLYERMQGLWKCIDTLSEPISEVTRQFGGVIRTGINALFSLAPNVYRYDGSAWNKLVIAKVASLSMKSESDILAVGSEVWHFNGRDWRSLTVPFVSSDFYRSGCYIDGKEVFILEYGTRISRVLHGK